MEAEVAVGQNQWYHFGVGAPPILVHLSGDWDVYWGYGVLTRGQVAHLGLGHVRGRLDMFFFQGLANPPQFAQLKAVEARDTWVMVKVEILFEF